MTRGVAALVHAMVVGMGTVVQEVVEGLWDIASGGSSSSSESKAVISAIDLFWAGWDTVRDVVGKGCGFELLVENKNVDRGAGPGVSD